MEDSYVSLSYQHAKSKEEDPERGITDGGRVETERIAEYFRSLNPEIHVIWQSGKKRTKKTAEIFARALGIDNRILEHSNLSPNDPVGSVTSALEKMHRNVIIVGHLPFLPRLISHLTTGTDSCQIVNFRNSGIICLERNENQWGIMNTNPGSPQERQDLTSGIKRAEFFKLITSDP